jgi:S1-C subfamily serine protease
LRSGTGFFVSTTGRLVTSAHVVEDCRRITVWPERQTGRVAHVVALDRGLDIALLAAGGEPVPVIAATAEHRDRHPGETIATIGFGVSPARPREALVSTGAIDGETHLPSGRRVLVIRALLAPGNSGAPVLDAGGGVIGVITGRFTRRPGLAVATPAPQLERFLVQNGVEPAMTLPDDRQPVDLAERLSGISALVECAVPQHR